MTSKGMAVFSPNINQLLQAAVEHHQAGRLPEAETLYRQILAQDANHPEALHFLGLLAAQVQRREVAMELMRRAIAARPTYADAYSNLGNVLKDEGRLAEAIAAQRQAIALEPTLAEAHYNLGVVLALHGQFAEAAAAYRKALALKVHYPEAHYNLGVVLEHQGQREEAMAAYREAIVRKPDFSDAYYNLGNLLKKNGQLDEAMTAYRQALARKPDFPEAWGNLGSTLRDQGQFDEAVAAYRRALALKPDFAEVYNNLGTALGEMGLSEEASAVFRQALAFDSNMSAAHSNLLCSFHYLPSYGLEVIAEEHRRWNRQHGVPLAQFMVPHGNNRDPERRLRIGYVSPDFRQHAVAPMVLPLVASHDRSGFEIFCYGQVERPDAMTERFRQAADHWRDTTVWSDDQMAAAIRQDQIDILVDLAGHTAGNRLLVFARKPAPVQVARQGYPDTTGLETIDYRISDSYADPPGLSDRLHTEKLVRLPETNWIYQPSEEAIALEVTPLAEGPVTFGCFNNLAKVTEPMLRLWAKILAAVPGSRLLLKARALATESVQARVRAILAQEGIAPERVELGGWRMTAREHLALYNRVAIALDPFPYQGTTTTCEALWMGVPVVSLAGQTHVSRVGVSLLHNVGLPELIGQNAEEYVRIAVALAQDRRRLEELRAGLRERMRQSPLLDWSSFARHMEAAYRQMWRTWCTTTAGQ
jgi:predicted O-linked N-acetylglucosamine transferase (SPINDLY family)